MCLHIISRNGPLPELLLGKEDEQLHKKTRKHPESRSPKLRASCNAAEHYDETEPLSRCKVLHICSFVHPPFRIS